MTVLRTDDPFVLTLTSIFPAKRSAVDLFECTIAAIEIPRAIVLRSEKLAA